MGQPHLILNLNPMPGGFSVGAWRTGERSPESYATIDHFAEIARIAERGKFDAYFLADFASWNSDSAYRPPRFLDPTVVLSYLSAVTSHIGLIATASTSYNTPYNLARRMMSIDHVSRGRVGWNAVVTAGDDAARNFSLDAAAPTEARYARAREFVELVQALWSSWEPDALPADVESGVYVDVGKVRPVDFAGEHFRVAGPLVTARSPQGNPVIVQAGGSSHGADLAARYANVVFTVQNDIEESRRYRSELRARVQAHGRDPDSIKLLPGVVTIIGRTEQEAKDRADYLTELVPIEVRLQGLARQLQLPVAVLSGDLDGPLPWDLISDEALAGRDHRATLLKGARDNASTIRQLISQSSATHGSIIGSPEQIADTLQHWFETGAADGFNIMPAESPKGVSDFVDLVVPVLQDRGLFRREYTETTLRGHYGLPALA